ncbi:hypothetical protein [Micromonospora sp. CPCC 205556]|uniref:hypothetical protein n=1 Tax=Micromonospora sp. CPCC 205556 TaxID=3122398 RepID=UPI002FEF2FC7
MIVASLLLILVAVVLLVLGLADGSSALLISSIAASLLAAVALVAGARQVAAARATTSRDRPRGRGRLRVPRTAAPRAAYSPVATEIPVQHVPPRNGTDGDGWRQPPEPSVTGAAPHAAGTTGPWEPRPEAPWEPDPAGPWEPDPADPTPTSGAGRSAEPEAQHVSPADAARVATLHAEIRVVDGHPRYHLASCAYLVDRDHEPLPVSEAVALGFTPCGRCAPDTTLLADAPD